MDRKKKKAMAWKAGMCPSLLCFIYQKSLLNAVSAFETRPVKGMFERITNFIFFQI
jgi:hypothetical protein